MLVLSRHRDESIMVGDDVEITVIDIRGDKARLGIDAPKAIGVHRKEVYLAIQQEGSTKKNDGADQTEVPDVPRASGTDGGETVSVQQLQDAH